MITEEEWDFEDKYPALAKRKQLIQEGVIDKDQSGARGRNKPNNILEHQLPTTKEPYYGHE